MSTEVLSVEAFEHLAETSQTNQNKSGWLTLKAASPPSRSSSSDDTLEAPSIFPQTDFLDIIKGHTESFRDASSEEDNDWVEAILDMGINSAVTD
ncbi:MAG: hypothetical protein Q9188_005081 [Gyalolechia gomerana]